MRKILKIFFIFMLLLFYIMINAYIYSKEVSKNLSNSVVRLHIIANSNSEQDQNLKYIVRDNLIEYMNSIEHNFSSKEDAIKYISAHLDKYKEIVENTISENGFEYNCSVNFGKFAFPTKSYDDITFPAGTYDAIKVQIGKADGKNWWCVLYPSLCFVNNDNTVMPDRSKNVLKQELSEEEYKLISSNDSDSIKIKFKFVELFNSYKGRLSVYYSSNRNK